MGGYVGLQQRMFLLQVLDVGKIFAIIVRSQVTFHLIEPQFNILDVAVKLLLLVGLAEFDS